MLPYSVPTGSLLKSRLNVTRLLELDAQLREYAKLHSEGTPRCGWVRTIRLAYGMSSGALGRRVGISAQGVRKLEAAEAEGAITLRTLARIAHGLDCEVRYVLVPRTSLVEQVTRRAREHQEGPNQVEAHTTEWDAGALIAFASVLERLGRKEFW